MLCVTLGMEIFGRATLIIILGFWATGAEGKRKAADSDSLQYYVVPLQLAVQNADKNAEADACVAMAEYFCRRQQDKKALEVYWRAYTVSRELNDTDRIGFCLQKLSESAERAGDFRSAFQFLQKLRSHDSTRSAGEASAIKVLKKELQESKQIITQLQQVAKSKNAAGKDVLKQSENKSTIIYTLFGVLSAVLLAGRISLKRRKRKAVQGMENSEPETQSFPPVPEATIAMEKKSIPAAEPGLTPASVPAVGDEFATRVQQALMPSLKIIRSLLPQSFLVQNSKQRITPFFLWTSFSQGRIYLSVGSTGKNGIASVLSEAIIKNSLNEALQQKAGMPVDELFKRTIDNYNAISTSEGNNVELAILSLHLQLGRGTVHFASSTGEMVIMTGSSNCPNAQEGDAVQKERVISVTQEAKKGDMIYLLAGTSVQSQLFNEQLKADLTAITPEPLEVQKSRLQDLLNDGTGGKEVCVVGIKI